MEFKFDDINMQRKYSITNACMALMFTFLPYFKTSGWF